MLNFVSSRRVDIIESVEGPTSWVSPLVAVPKSNGEVRVCVDMWRANEAVIREGHPIPTLEEKVRALAGATVFSKLDLRWGYHRIELHPESRGLIPQGLKRYKRLIFDLSSASEIICFSSSTYCKEYLVFAIYPMTLLFLERLG